MVITGVGSVSPLGAGGFAATATALDAGRPGIAPLRQFPTDAGASQLGAEVSDETLADLMDPEEARRLSRVCQLTIAACRLALRDARFDPAGSGAELGLIIGTEFGDLRSTESFALGYLRRGPVGLSPLLFPNTVMNIMSATATIAIGARAASVTLNQPTVAGDLAVAHAAALVASGRLPSALAGGVDEISPTVYRMLSQFRVLSPMDGGPEGCFPFDRRHNGPVLGEGATFVLLEPLEVARERGAPIYGEIRGAAWGSHPAGRGRVPRRPGNGSAIARALAQASLPADGITWAYLTGTGDARLDDWELSLVQAAFGAHRPRLTSLTSLAGDHAGLGALRVAGAAWTTRTRRFPAVVGLRDPVRTDCVFAMPGTTNPAGGAGLVHGVARGGTQVALVVAPPEDAES